MSFSMKPRNVTVAPARKSLWVTNPTPKERRGHKMSKVNVKVTYVNKNLKGKTLFRANKDDAGFDLCAAVSGIIHPGQTAIVDLGIRTEFTPGFEAQVRPRSGLAAKKHITITNSPGTIDAGFRGVWGAIITNLHPSESFVFAEGDKIAQAVFKELPEVEIEEAEELSESDRGVGGFGSSDKPSAPAVDTVAQQRKSFEDQYTVNACVASMCGGL